jgi:hypothetical protein
MHNQATLWKFMPSVEQNYEGTASNNFGLVMNKRRRLDFAFTSLIETAVCPPGFTAGHPGDGSSMPRRLASPSPP